MAQTSKNNSMETAYLALGRIQRRKWWGLLVFWVGALAAVGVVGLLPDKYTSTATLVVAQQRISESYVPNADKQVPADAIQMMKYEILSHRRLLSIIEELNLYPDEWQNVPPELLTERIRGEVEIVPMDEVRRTDARVFQIRFTASKAVTAQAVVQKLSSLFVEENAKDRDDRATRSAEFIASGLKAAKSRVEEQDRRLRDAQARQAVEQSRRLAANDNITDLRLRLQGVQSSLSQANQQRMSLESMATSSLAKLQSDKDTLLVKLRQQHPDVIRKDEQIARLERLLEQIRSGVDAAPAPNDDPVIVQIRSQASSVLAQIRNYSTEEQKLHGMLQELQSREDRAPAHEQEVKQLEQENSLYRREYEDLVLKQGHAEQVVSLNDRQEGEHFRMIEAATLPLVPTGPQRSKFILGGVGASFVFGLIVALLVDFLKGGLYAESELAAIAPVPLIISLPMIATSAEKRTSAYKRIFEWAMISTLTVLVAAAVAAWRHGWS